MNTNDDNGKAATLDTEHVMEGVRRQIAERGEAGQSQVLPLGASLPNEFYDHLYRAGLARAELGVKPAVIKSDVPLFGPLIDRLRTAAHDLVIFYVNRLADQQSVVDGHLLKALGALDQVAPGEASNSLASAGLRNVAARNRGGDWATTEDVYACYRLLLDREPDEAGWDYWSSLVSNHYVSRSYLVDSFLSGHEFKALQVARNEPQLVEIPEYNFRMYVRLNDNFIGAVIAREKYYEPHVTRVLHSHLKRGSTFIDVGANIGYFSMLAAAAVGPEGRVESFEPNASNCDLIRRSVAANRFEGVVNLHPVAVAEAAQWLHFSTAGVDSNGRVVNLQEAAGEVVPLPSVEAVALDEALRECPRVDVIKMDVEGAEARVWQGMQAVIRRHKPVLVFEFSPTLLQRTSEIAPQAFLEAVRADYDLFVILPRGDTAAKPDSIDGIMAAHANSGLTHLDILARPRR